MNTKTYAGNGAGDASQRHLDSLFTPDTLKNIQRRLVRKLHSTHIDSNDYGQSHINDAAQDALEYFLKRADPHRPMGQQYRYLWQVVDIFVSWQYRKRPEDLTDPREFALLLQPQPGVAVKLSGVDVDLFQGSVEEVAHRRGVSASTIDRKRAAEKMALIRRYDAREIEGVLYFCLPVEEPFDSLLHVDG